MNSNRNPEQADVLDMVVRLKKAAEQRAAPLAQADVAEGSAELEFPAEFYQYFTFVKAA